MRVLFINTFSQDRVSAVDYWRIINPAKALKRKTNWQIDIIDDIPKVDYLNKLFLDYAKKYDVIISNYHSNGYLLGYFDYIHRHFNVKYAISIDDDVFSIDDDNPTYDYYKQHLDKLVKLQTVLSLAPNLIVTNTHLLHTYSKVNKNNIVKMDNYIDKDLYIPKGGLKKIDHKKIVIGYQGGSTHRKDLLESGFYTAVVRILKKYGNKVSFHLFGGRISELEALPQVVYQPGYRNYLEYVKNWQTWITNIDIGVAPLIDKEFNYGKSNIKVQEYGIAGVPVIASDICTYQNILNDKNGVLVKNTADDWERELTQLIDDKQLRLHLGKELKKTVDRKAIDNHVNQIIQMIEKLK